MDSPSTPQQVLDRLQWRYATKKFDPSQKILDETWKALEQSLVLAPSSFGLQPWKFLVVLNPDLRQQLLEPAWGQKQVVDASHLVVFAARTDVTPTDVDRHIEHMAEVQSVSTEKLSGLAEMTKGYLSDPPFPLDKPKWSAKQAYIALGFFLHSAAMLGIDTCAMEGFIPSKYDEILGLKGTGYSSVVLCTAGYRAADDTAAERKKVRYATDVVVEYLD